MQHRMRGADLYQRMAMEDISVAVTHVVSGTPAQAPAALFQHLRKFPNCDTYETENST